MAQIDNIKQSRLDKLESIKKSGLNPFPSKSRKNHCINQILDDFSKLSKSKKKVILAGRIMSIRGHGEVTFLDVRDGTGKIQAFLSKDKVKEKKYRHRRYY
jgi:lysyl-tRNA synthetase class 2